MHTFDPEIIGGDFYIYSLIYTLSRVNYWSYIGQVHEYFIDV
jgi:hypothetical protein